jgi:hypothetical protein
VQDERQKTLTQNRKEERDWTRIRRETKTNRSRTQIYADREWAMLTGSDQVSFVPFVLQ